MPTWIDVVYAGRQLRKKPVFTAAAVFIVAVGLSLTVYTFALLNQLIFKPLTLNGDSPLVAISGEYVERYGRGLTADPFHLNQVSAESELLAGMSLYHSTIRAMSGQNDNSGLYKVHVTYSQWNLFEVAGVTPILGRGFTPDDQAVGAEPVVVLSYEIWNNLFSARDDIIGTVVQVEARPVRVIGVMPEGFAFPAIAQVWQVMPESRMYPAQPSNRGGLHAVGRLQPDASLSQLQQEVNSILHRHFQALPQEFAWRASSEGGYIRVFPFKLTNDAIAHHYSVFVALMIVAILILLLTCLNVGNLLLARANEQMQDLVIRVALGVPKSRLIFQLFSESVLICGLGAIIAFFLVRMGVHITNATFNRLFALNDERPFWWQLEMGSDDILVLLVVTLSMILFTGSIPAWRAFSRDISATLRDGTRGALGKKAGRINKALVTIEIGLSCVVLVIAALLLGTSYNAQHADYGAQTQNRLTAAVRLAAGTYPWNGGAADARNKRSDFYEQLKTRLESFPNIENVAFFSSLPGTGGGTSHFEIRGREAHAFNENPTWNFEVVSRDAWAAVDMKLIAGRSFDSRDLTATQAPVIVNASLASDLFPNGDALGQRVRTVTEEWQTDWRTIIGIVSDTVHGLTMHSTSAHHTGYGLMDLMNWRVNIVIQYSGAESLAISALQETIADMNADASVHHVQSYQSLIEQPMQMVNAVNTIFMWAGLVALVLAASGIYAVAANSIALRTQEIATRRALGAKNKQILTMFLQQTVGQLIVGLFVGLTISMWLVTRLTQSMVIDTHSYLYGVIGVPLFIALIVLVAVVIPTTSITKAEPSEGLRHG